jgi:hypothetical protein
VAGRTVLKAGMLPKVEGPARACRSGRVAEARSRAQAHVTAKLFERLRLIGKYAVGPYERVPGGAGEAAAEELRSQGEGPTPMGVGVASRGGQGGARQAAASKRADAAARL